MTRLTGADIGPILERLDEYDALLKQKTGASLRQIASRAAGIEEGAIMERPDRGPIAAASNRVRAAVVPSRVRVAAIPVRAGLGVINGFSDTVAGIASHLGFEAFVTDATDVAGLAEGIDRGANVLMLADDDRFIAFIPELGRTVDNAPATAQGFVAGLEFMRGGLSGASALVLGCGPVGVAGAKALLHRGADVALCDLRHERVEAALRALGHDAAERIRVEEDAELALPRYELIFEATNAGAFIEAAHLGPNALVAAPGLPCALTAEAMAKHGGHVLHDPLEIGTATMVLQAAAMMAGDVGAGRAREDEARSEKPEGADEG